MNEARRSVRADRCQLREHGRRRVHSGRQTATAYQSEADLEREFIRLLQSQAYEYLPITTEAQLVANLRTQLEALNSITFSDAEWEQLLHEKIAGRTTASREDRPNARGPVQVLKRDDGTTKNV